MPRFCTMKRGAINFGTFGIPARSSDSLTIIDICKMLSDIMFDPVSLLLSRHEIDHREVYKKKYNRVYKEDRLARCAEVEAAIAPIMSRVFSQTGAKLRTRPQFVPEDCFRELMKIALDNLLKWELLETGKALPFVKCLKKAGFSAEDYMLAFYDWLDHRVSGLKLASIYFTKEMGPCKPDDIVRFIAEAVGTSSQKAQLADSNTQEATAKTAMEVEVLPEATLKTDMLGDKSVRALYGQAAMTYILSLNVQPERLEHIVEALGLRAHPSVEQVEVGPNNHIAITLKAFTLVDGYPAEAAMSLTRLNACNRLITRIYTSIQGFIDAGHRVSSELFG